MLDIFAHRKSGENYTFGVVEKNIEFALHAHDTYEFIYCFDGVINVRVLDRIYRVREGKCILISPNEVHSYETPDLSKVFVFNFSKDFISDYYLEHKNLIASYPVFSINSPDNFCKEIVAETDYYAIKGKIFQMISAYNAHTAFMKLDIKKNKLLSEVTTYIAENLDKDITLKELAVKFDYSYNYLSAVLNDAFSKNYADVVNMYRINRASQLLCSTDKTIQDISKEVGYSSIRSFNRNYKKLKGTAPTTTRDILKKGIIVSI